jgi:hypothetical protein
VADEDTRWIEVLAKAAALIAMKGADVDDEPLAQGKFLMGLGITESEASTMLGLGVSTLRNAKNRVKKSKGGRNGKTKGKR